MTCDNFSQTKDPSAVLSYGFDYGTLGWLDDGDSISTSVWAADSGVTLVSSSNTTTVASVLISGGTAGEDYEITNTITTANGLTEQRSFTLRVRET